MIRKTALAFGMVALQACASTDPATPEDDARKPPLPAASIDDLTRTMDGVVGGGIAPGVSITVDHPKYERWSGAAGVKSLDTGEALATSDRFRGGSILKVAVAAAVLQLVESGALSLDASLPELLPGDIAQRIDGAESITLRMLLGHTSGLAEFDDAAFHALYAADPMRIWTFDELLERALAMPRTFEPGAGWAYTNTGYVLLGKILETATGEPWRDTVRWNVLTRADTSKSELPAEGDPSCPGCAHGYHPQGDALIDMTQGDPSMAGAAGGEALITTPEDLAKLLRTLASGRLFEKPETVALMTTFVDAPVPNEAQTGYGLGLTRFQVGDVELYGHIGSTAGYQSFVLYEPSSGIVASGSMNRYGDLGAFIMPVLGAVSRIE